MRYTDRSSRINRAREAEPVAEFIRARSDVQKEQRLGEIKRAAAELFAERPYHEITLKAVSERLGWSHAALYKYVTTKEEIFLELAADARRAYTDDLLAAYPEGCSYSRAVLAEVWAEQLASHRDYLAYAALLFTIIETNVTVERLAAFKRAYYDELEQLAARFHANLCLAPERADRLFNAVLFHASSMNGWCADNPLVKDALALVGLSQHLPDFKAEMREFIGMCLDHYCA